MNIVIISSFLRSRISRILFTEMLLTMLLVVASVSGEYPKQSPILDIQVKPMFVPAPRLFRNSLFFPTGTIDSYSASLNSSEGLSSVNIFANTVSGNQRPQNVHGASFGGTQVEFYGSVRSIFPPYLVPLRVISARAKGKGSGYAYYRSKPF